MNVVSQVRSFDRYRITGPEVDVAGLGGRVDIDSATASPILDGYWGGGPRNPQCRRAGAYLRDLRASLRASASCLRPGGFYVTVIGRRLLGGWRLRTDHFVDDTLAEIGFTKVERRRRRILAKVTPPFVNRMARAARGSVGRARVRTMRDEWILVHRSPPHRIRSWTPTTDSSSRPGRSL